MSPRQKRLKHIRDRITKAKRIRVFALDRGQCVYCGVPACTLDHAVPVRAMAYEPPRIVNAIDNLVAACFTCNNKLGAVPYEQKVFRYGRFASA